MNELHLACSTVDNEPDIDETGNDGGLFAALGLNKRGWVFLFIKKESLVSLRESRLSWFSAEEFANTFQQLEDNSGFPHTVNVTAIEKRT